MRVSFQRGLVVGKFSPLHRGHQFLIDRALEQCAEVVAISYSKPEFPGCEAVHRDRWFAALYPHVRHLAVTDERLRAWGADGPREVPANDASALEHRRFCGFLCRHVLGVRVDAVFSSEDYGAGFAEELTRYFGSASPVAHVMVDRERQAVAISGTQVRADVHRSRAWLAPAVYTAFTRRICFLGGESSGKSTLAAALATELGGLYVAEYGRELWEANAGQLVLADMRHIAEVQIEREEAAAFAGAALVCCDTSPLTTLFYSRFMFGEADPALERMAERHYDHTVLCAPDFAFVQDGTRRAADFRQRQHDWYLNEFARRSMAFQLVTGSLLERLAQLRAFFA